MGRAVAAGVARGVAVGGGVAGMAVGVIAGVAVGMAVGSGAVVAAGVDGAGSGSSSSPQARIKRVNPIRLASNRGTFQLNNLCEYVKVDTSKFYTSQQVNDIR